MAPAAKDGRGAQDNGQRDGQYKQSLELHPVFHRANNRGYPCVCGFLRYRVQRLVWADRLHHHDSIYR